MADTSFNLPGLSTALPVKAVDLGDGTYAFATRGGTGTSSTTVQGTAADGAAAVGNPVQTGGVDGSGNVQAFLSDTGGRAVVIGAGFESAPTVTRPANTTAYTAGDVVGGAFEFTAIGNAGGFIFITGADLMVFVSAVPSGMANMRCHLYNVTPPSALADNAPWDLPSGDRASYLGYVDFGTPVDMGSTLQVQAVQVNQEFKLAAASTSLFAYIQTIGAFTPAGNSEVYMPRLRAVSA